MKKVKVTVIAILSTVLLFSSCQKDSSFPINDLQSPGLISISKESLKLVKKVEQLPTSLIYLGHGMLNPEEKVVFWNRHIDKFIASRDLEPDLKAHILKLKKFISVDLYKNLGTPESNEYIASFEKSWLFEPIESGRFDAKTLILASSLMGAGSVETTVRSLNNQAVAVNSETCNCIYSIYCILGNEGLCTTGNCTQGGFSCGITGSSNCSGRCI